MAELEEGGTIISPATGASVVFVAECPHRCRRAAHRYYCLGLRGGRLLTWLVHP